MEKKYSPFWVALITSICVCVVIAFLLFFFLRADIATTKSFITTTLQEHNTLLEQTFDNELSIFQEAIVHNIDTAKDSVVSIVASRNVQLYMLWPDRELSVAERETQVGGWSGIIVSKSGYIITNRHVVENPDVSYSIITNDWSAYDVKNVWIDPVLDIAILAISYDDTFVDSTQVASFLSHGEPILIGQFAFAIGNALTQWQNTVTFGVISAKNRELRMQWNNIYAWLLQTDTSINPGNSWGPLLDVYGKVIGINTAISQFGQWIGFALPVTQQFVDASLSTIQEYGKIVRPYLGIIYTDITPSVQQELGISTISHGIYIRDIVSNSPAFEAGLLWWDIIIALNNISIDDDFPFLYQLYTYQPGDTIRLDILRSGDRMHIDVVLWDNI